jgi:hypothetical protein
MKFQKTPTWLPYLLIGVFLVFYASILSYKVISKPTPFMDWDESIYVEVGKEMVQSHSLVPLWEGKAWLEKPPLVPLFYGSIIQFIPVNPEVSTRVASVLLGAAMLFLLYLFVQKASKSSYFALFVVIVTALNPLVLQRSQIVNTDVFLLIGWLGYFLTYKHFKRGLFFLFMGVFSKSLLGFYPLILIFLFELFQFFRTKDKKFFFSLVRKMIFQIALLSIWYIIMIIVFKGTFIQVHFTDHLVKRITKSIESHFGQRTFYFEIIKNYWGTYLYFAVIPFSIIILGILYLKKKIEAKEAFFHLTLLPWFLFLNITKTKIEWYLYPAIPGLVLLILYPLELLRKQHVAFIGVITILLLIFLKTNYPLQSILTTRYSSYGDIYNLSVSAKSNCSELNILVDETSRHDQELLRKNNLLISTSDIYGQFPSIMYYSEKNTNIYYDKEKFIDDMKKQKINSCWSFDEKDSDISTESSIKEISKFGPHYLFKRV